MSYSSYSINSRLTSLKNRSDQNDLKPLCISVAEFEGLIETNTYPFSFGMGSPSSPGFGLPVSFEFKLLGFSLICDTPDANPNIIFQIEYYNFGSSSNPEIIDTCNLGESKFIFKNERSKTFKAGIICVKAVSAENLTYEFSKYRFALNLQSEHMF